VVKLISSPYYKVWVGLFSWEQWAEKSNFGHFLNFRKRIDRLSL
jgi:hypothetical protein